MLPRLDRPGALALALLVIAFAAPGLLDHDPWKTVDAVAISIVHGMHVTGDWLVPRVAGEPWLDDPPLFHWTALAFAKPLGALLGFHNAVRIASALFLAVALALLYRAASTSAPSQSERTEAAAAVLLVLGAVGLMVHAHEAYPRLATLTAVAGVLASMARGRHVLDARAAVVRGAFLGISLAGAFLAAGPAVPIALGAAIAITQISGPQRNSGNEWLLLGCGAMVAVLLSAAWPLALQLRHPDLAALWWQHTIAPPGQWFSNLRYLLATASWFAWPAWLLAGWAAWSLRRKMLEPRLLVPALSVLFLLAAAALSGPPRDFALTPLLPPLALLAASGLVTLRRGAAAALDWFGAMTFAFFGGLVWLGYVAMMTGFPPRVANNFVKLAPGFSAQFEPASLAVAVALTLGWLYVLFYSAPSPLRSVLRWSAGLTLLWGVFAMLWMDWADYQRSYRAVALELQSKLPARTPCVAERNLGISQRAAFHYHAGIVTQAFETNNPSACPVVLVQGAPGHEAGAPGPGWRKLADAGRPGDKLERYRLYASPR